MTAATTTLTDFLLARIMERRERIRRTLGHEPLSGRQRVAEFLAVGSVRRGQEARAFEEAMRLDDLALQVRRERRSGVLDSPDLRRAAAIYSGHPDYDPAWA